MSSRWDSAPSILLACWVEAGWVQLLEARLGHAAKPALQMPGAFFLPTGVLGPLFWKALCTLITSSNECWDERLPGQGSLGGLKAPAHPPPALATAHSPGRTQSQRTALWGQGWVKIAWAGIAQLPSQPGTSGHTWNSTAGKVWGPSVGEKPGCCLGEAEQAWGRGRDKQLIPLPASQEPRNGDRPGQGLAGLSLLVAGAI